MITQTPTPVLTGKSAQISRFHGALWGMFIGDALAMPVHLYFNRAWLQRYNGFITDYQPPKNPHPESSLTRMHCTPVNEKSDIYRDNAKYWKKPGTHFHQFLHSGENTLNLRLASQLIESLIECGGYDQDNYIKRYLDFMLTEGRHNDTYIDQSHRNFFQNYGRGKDPRHCGMENTQIGGLALTIPLMLYYTTDLKQAKEAINEHLNLTHPGETLRGSAQLLTEILHHLLEGYDLETALFEKTDRQTHPTLGYPYRRWLEKPHEEIIGVKLNSAGYVEEALPAAIYFALKYQSSFEQALVHSTNMGGENCYRGAVLGAILGAAKGCENIPGVWVTGLTDSKNYEHQISELFKGSDLYKTL